MLLLSVRPVDAFEDQMFLQKPPGRTLSSTIAGCRLFGNNPAERRSELGDVIRQNKVFSKFDISPDDNNRFWVEN
jgi:hypothetical protein